jgi:4-methylaminobutanoate oxidase (formaldehyde-forming)
MDVRRFGSHYRSRGYARDRAYEVYATYYDIHYPGEERQAGRPLKVPPAYARLQGLDAEFGEKSGWERVNWFRSNEDQAHENRRPRGWAGEHWSTAIVTEHLVCRERAALFDESSFAKLEVSGPGAVAFLQRICANDVDRPIGSVVYTQMLNRRGGIESDLTVTRLSETAFLLVVPGATLQRDLAWVRRHVGDAFATVTDVSAAEAVFAIMGPKARDLMRSVSPDDFSNAGHPYGTAREIEVGMGLARAHRVSYVGELGWELYVPTDQAAHVFETLEEAGAAQDLRLCGLHALDSCRIEKAFRHFGHDITDEDHVLEAGLGFAVKTAKGGFIGRDAVLCRRDEGLARRLLQFRLRDPEPLVFRNEGVVRDGRIVGIVTSGNYGHHLGAAVGLGYVPCEGESAADVLASTYEIEIAGRRFPAEASLRPLYDPAGTRVRM